MMTDTWPWVSNSDYQQVESGKGEIKRPIRRGIGTVVWGRIRRGIGHFGVG